MVTMTTEDKSNAVVTYKTNTSNNSSCGINNKNEDAPNILVYKKVIKKYLTQRDSEHK